NVTAVDFKSKPVKVSVGDDTHEGDAIVIATGSSAKWLGIPSEEKLRGHGVSACATCDGFFFKEKEVVVVGGGDTAMEESLFLTKFASVVSVVHRRDELRASAFMQERAKKNEKIKFIWDSVVEEVLGKETVEGVRLKNVKTGETTDFKCQGLFLAIGHNPNTDVFKGHIGLDKKGYIVVKNNTRTSVEGVFVAGDAQDFRYRQAVTAAGSGCMAAIDAEKFLEGEG
ncbi:MAG: FAD-dependent oxidoreductase, partial [Thermoplasmata archaeon]|nr:FAD-dependent oxidoreductase [Thermoplasmata archaeon]